jgi:hypothetical protein
MWRGLASPISQEARNRTGISGDLKARDERLNRKVRRSGRREARRRGEKKREATKRSGGQEGESLESGLEREHPLQTHSFFFLSNLLSF